MPRRIGYATAAILAAIDRGKRYGLTIMEATGLPSGTVYPTLVRLEHRGLVGGIWEPQATADREKRPRRRYYHLTKAGESALTDSLRLYGSLGSGKLTTFPAPSSR